MENKVLTEVLRQIMDMNMDLPKFEKLDRFEGFEEWEQQKIIAALIKDNDESLTEILCQYQDQLNTMALKALRATHDEHEDNTAQKLGEFIINSCIKYWLHDAPKRGMFKQTWLDEQIDNEYCYMRQLRKQEESDEETERRLDYNERARGANEDFSRGRAII